MNVRVAAIDVGTNSIQLLVAEVAPDGSVRVVERDRQQVELGTGGLADHRITPEAFRRGVRALQAFATTARTFEVEDVYCTATSAVREASNGADFCRAVKDATDIHVRVIPGLEEARLIWLGARSDLDFSKGRITIFDLGGGSTEFILCDVETPLAVESLAIGHIRCTEQHRRADPLSDSDRGAIRDAVRAAVKPLLKRIRGDDFHTLVGTSGAVRTLARMGTLERGGVVPAHDHGLVLYQSEVEALIDRFMALPASRLEEIPGMDAARRRTLPAAAVIVREVMKAFGKDRLVTSERGLRDGLVADWVMKHRPEIGLSRTVTDPRRRSALAVMRRYETHETHAQHVVRTALALFDATTEVHDLRIDDRRLLEFAALLHDIGHHISGQDHDKHGEYLVRHSRMPGFTAPEIALIGLLVRYHRGTKPKTTHPDYQALSTADRRRVRILSALLSVADALDRGHRQNVEEVDARVDDGRLVVRALTREAPDVEQWAAVRREDLLATALGIEVRLHVEQRPVRD